jgi:hypothetical protein
MSQKLGTLIRAFSMVGAIALTGCGDNPSSEGARKWLVEQGYAVDENGLKQAVDDYNAKAIRYFVAADAPRHQITARFFVFRIGSCDGINAEPCIEAAKAFRAAGFTKKTKIPGGDTTIVDVFANLQKRLTNNPYVHSAPQRLVTLNTLREIVGAD